MIEEVLPGIFRIQVGLPNNPLKYLNSYVIRSSGRNLIIDTGMNRHECLHDILSGLKDLGIQPEQCDIFVTHHHADHLGLVATLARPDTQVFVNRLEVEQVRSEDGWQSMYRFYLANGFPPEKIDEAFYSHPGRRYQLRDYANFQYMSDGDTIVKGDYLFRCLEVPGHTPAHLCLYEARQRILIAGDHVLFDITPNISCSTDNINPLGDYLKSLDRVYPMDVRLVLPGHRRLSSALQGRIDQLRAHHQSRANEVLASLENGKKKTAFQIAGDISWDIDCETWDSFPLRQKWFAIGETLAHLKYLENMRAVVSALESKHFFYTLT